MVRFLDTEFRGEDVSGFFEDTYRGRVDNEGDLFPTSFADLFTDEFPLPMQATTDNDIRS